jgi:hypothetical protein
VELTLQNASFQTLYGQLKEQRDRKVDLIVPARDLCFDRGQVKIRNAGEPVLTDSGVTPTHLTLDPSNVFDEGLSSKLGIPRAYLRTLRDNGWYDLVDANVNRLLYGHTEQRPSDGSQPTGRVVRDPDARRFLVRTFRGEDGRPGYARAFLSDSYKTLDNWDILNAAMEGMSAAGLGANVVHSADLTDRRMYMKVVVPEISMLAPELLKDYRSPFSGKRGADNPMVFAGVVIGNSETGNGSFFVRPEIQIQVCDNGMTIKQDVISRRHLGAKVEDDGVIQYSDETQKKNLELIKLQTRDAIRTFLNVDYMTRVVQRVTEQAGAKVDKPSDVVTRLVKRDAFSKEDAEGLLDRFIQGGDMSRGGVLQAVTAYSQDVRATDPDRAHDMNMDALDAAGFRGITGLVTA